MITADARLKRAMELYEQGDAFWQAGRMAEALASYDAAESISRSLRRILIFPSQRRFVEIVAGQILLSGAMLLTRTGADPIGAEKRYRQAQALLARSGADRPEFLSCLNNFGLFLQAQGRFAEAETVLRQALEHGSRIPGADVTATLNNLATLSFSRGDYEPAKRLFVQVLQASAANPPTDALATTVHNNLGLIEQALGRPAQALEHLQLSLELLTHVQADFTFDPVRERALTLGNMGVVYLELNDPQQAVRHCKEAYEILRRHAPDAVETAMALQQYSLAMGSAGDPRTTSFQQEAVRLALRAAPRSLQTAHMLMGTADRLSPEANDEAFRLLYEAQDILAEIAPRSRVMANVLQELAIARFLAQERSDEAVLAWSQRALDIAREIGDAKIMTLSLELQAHLAWNVDDYETARAHLEEALEIVERLRVHAPPGAERSRVAVSLARPHHPLIGVLLEDEDRRHANIERSFDVMEAFRARSLLDLLDDRAYLGRGTTVPDFAAVSELARLNDEIQRAAFRPDVSPAQLESLEHRRLELQEQAETAARRRFLALPAYDVRATVPQGVLDELRQVLPDDTLYVAYEAAERYIYYWAVRRSGNWCGGLAITHEELPGLVEAAVTPGHEARADALDRLADLLVLDKAAVAGVNRLILSPSGALHRLPFEILPISGGKVVADQWVVSYVPSVAVMLAISKRETLLAPRGTFIGYGVAAGREGHTEIKNAELEVRDIAALFGPGGKAFTGPQATKHRVRATVAGNRYVHFAVHGQIDDTRPAYSALLLSPPEPGRESGPGLADRLQTFELFDLPLASAELVTCSACDSGRGLVRPGDGLVGMAEALFSAGARWVVVSLWPVPDAAAKRLMDDFYEGLEAGKDVPSALHKAKADARARFRTTPLLDRPFWPAFVALGAAPQQ